MYRQDEINYAKFVKSETDAGNKVVGFIEWKLNKETSTMVIGCRTCDVGLEHDTAEDAWYFLKVEHRGHDTYVEETRPSVQ